MNSTDTPRGEGWTTYEKHVLSELARLSSAAERTADKVDKIDDRLIVIEVRAGFLGILSGVLAALLAPFVRKEI
jgi:hypothetical protein